MFRILVFLFILSSTVSAFATDSNTDGSGQMPQKEIIAVLGTGDMGDSFGPRFAELGYRVIYGSRSPNSARVENLVKMTGNGALAMTYADAAKAADIVLIAVASHAVEQIVEQLGELDGKIVIDLNWPPSRIADDGYDEILTDISVAEQIQAMRPKAKVVKAFGTMASNVIDDPHVAGGPVTAPIASDHRQAKERVARIAEELGLDPVDAGPLRMARHLESLMMLYMIPHYQGREEGWDFYFRRSNYWACNSYTGDELDDAAPPVIDAGNLANIPHTQGEPQPCPSE